MNALQDNAYTRGWALIGRQVPRPKAVLSISAHWYIPGTSVTSMPAPRTIHDFSGFPRNCTGSFTRRLEIRPLRTVSVTCWRRCPLSATGAGGWTTGHGRYYAMYSPGRHPGGPLSMDQTMPLRTISRSAGKLAPLREEGVLIVGSGNITHNLRHAMASYQRGSHRRRTGRSDSTRTSRAQRKSMRRIFLSAPRGTTMGAWPIRHSTITCRCSMWPGLRRRRYRPLPDHRVRSLVAVDARDRLR